MTTQPKKLIEVALPLPEINDASAYDKMPGIGPHPKGIHHWWARAVLFASVVDDPSVREPFGREPDFGMTSVNYRISELLSRGGPPR